MQISWTGTQIWESAVQLLQLVKCLIYQLTPNKMIFIDIKWLKAGEGYPLPVGLGRGYARMFRSCLRFFDMLNGVYFKRVSWDRSLSTMHNVIPTS